MSPSKNKSVKSTQSSRKVTTSKSRNVEPNKVVKSSNSNTVRSNQPDVSKAIKQDNSGFPQMGSFLDRFLALLLDGLIFGAIIFFGYMVALLIMAIFGALATAISDSFADFVFGLTFLVMIGAYLGAFYFYYIYFYTKEGATLGKKIMKLKVVRADDMQYMNWWQVLLREIFGKWVSSMLFYLGYFWYFMSEKRQTWHDLITGTYVVKVDDNREILMDGPENYEKKPLFTFGPLGCSIIFWFLFFIVIFGSIFTLVTLGSKYDKSSKYDTDSYYQDDMGQDDDMYNDFFGNDNDDDYYNELPNRNNKQDKFYDNGGNQDNNKRNGDDLEKYLEDLFNEMEEK